MASFQSYGDGIGYIKGSPMIGNPITIMPKAMTISKTNTDDIIAFHRLIVEVKARLSTDADYTVITDSTSVENGEVVDFDISSALRAVADAYEYTPNPTSYPIIEFQVKAYDEYMLNGETKKNQGTCYLPSASTFYGALMGKYSDMERLKSNGFKRVTSFSRKPASFPEIVAVGESIVYVNDFSMPEGHVSGYDFADITTYMDDEAHKSIPKSIVKTITSEGTQIIGGRTYYAVPANSDRYQFRFINSLGVLDSISVYSLRETEVNITQDEQHVVRTESFDSISNAIVRKSMDYETWKLSSGPVDQQWQSWFIHEFLMAKHVWIYIDGVWVRCHIIPDETVKGFSRRSASLLDIQFSVRLDINGSL